jgi:nucleoside-diphosphate-sugar epimerase
MEIGLLGLPKCELSELANSVRDYLSQLDGQRVVILGGTGFIGKWFTATLSCAIQDGLDTELVVVSRQQPRLSIKSLQDARVPNVTFVKQDLSTTVPDQLLDTDQLIIAATPTSYVHGSLSNAPVDRTANSISRALANFEKSSSFRLRNIVHLSSGAVYRDSHIQSRKVDETDSVLTQSSDAYVRAKIRLEESLRSVHNKNRNVSFSNLRLFAFYGPGLPLDAHFALGNFMHDVLRNAAIQIKGHPSTTRSYLHISDLCRVLVQFMVLPLNCEVNVGSDYPREMISVATEMARVFGLPKPQKSDVGLSAMPTYYVPNTNLAQSHIGKFELKEFDQGLGEWKEWLEIDSR